MPLRGSSSIGNGRRNQSLAEKQDPPRKALPAFIFPEIPGNIFMQDALAGAVANNLFWQRPPPVF
ncbi:hypothetical protein A8C56_05685 [Niabella ginsenosidivorans]|uniref:Uncharacterized protein n=1 Tax=Niabella ginsenosidivorans TaxID=1176587 RepID=A0A1A9HYR9_9BACT|nr:hypothetical protein A8C56_05685 [Niabella ginsenosidivorans]